MKKFILVLFCFFLALPMILAKPKSKTSLKIPSWYEHKEITYPSEMYVSAIGEGESEAEARENAVAQISLFFNTTAEVYNDLLKEYNELENGKKYASSERTQITEMAIIRSSAEFFGVQFTDCFAAKNRVYVCAFIQREEAFKVYESEIKQNSATVAALLSSAQNGANPIRNIKSAEKAVKIASVSNALIKNARLLKSVPQTYFDSSEKNFSRAQSVLDSCLEKKAVSISVENDWNDMLYSSVAHLLEQEGFSVGNAKTGNAFHIAVSAEESEKAAGFFLLCSVSITASSDGKNYFSYSRTFDKKGARAKNDAYRLAYKMIASEIEKSFIDEFNAALSGDDE